MQSVIMEIVTPCGEFVMRIFFLGLVVLVGVACTPVPADAESQNSTLSVSGNGAAVLAPDMAILDLAVVSEAKTARAALSENSTAMTRVLDSLQTEGIAERDIQTSGFAIQPRYENRRNNSSPQPVILGYSVRNSLTVRVRDLDRVGAILDTSVSLGINQGGNIRFSNEDPAAALESARIAAVKDAEKKARTLAEAAGVPLGKMLSLSEQSHAAMPMPMARASMAMESFAVPVMGGENTYQVNVSVTYLLAD